MVMFSHNYFPDDVIWGHFLKLNSNKGEHTRAHTPRTHAHTRESQCLITMAWQEFQLACPSLHC